MRRSRSLDYVSVLWICAAIALLVRVWGIGFGLPHTRAQPDEGRVAGAAVNILRGDLDPGFFNYPTLFMYAAAASDAAYCAAAAAMGRFPGMAACAASWPTHWEPFFLLGRALSALLGTLAVLLVFVLARRVGDSERDHTAGLVAAGCLAVAWLHVRDSHFGVTDVAMTTAALGAIALLLRAHERPASHRFALAGLAAGLATSTKYNAVLLGAAVVASQAAALVSRPKRLDARILVFSACLAAGFLAGSPYALIDRSRFLADVAYEAAHLAGGHGTAIERGWRYHATITLPLAVGWPLLLAGVAGMFVSFRRATATAAIVFAFPVAYYLVAGRGLSVFARYMVPVVPFICIGAGALASWAGQWSGRTFGPAARAAAIATIAIGSVVPNLWKVVEMDRLLARTDSRVLATEWIVTHVAPGQTVYVSASEWGSPDLWLRGAPRSFSVLTDADQPLRGSARPYWIVVQQSPLWMYNGRLAEGDAVLREYDLRGAVRAYNPAVPHVFDQQDAFFLPLDGFRGLARPGPNFLFYERR